MIFLQSIFPNSAVAVNTQLARIQEIIDLRLCDFRFGKTPVVTLHGKGSKIRIVPVMENYAASKTLPSCLSR